MRLLLLVLILVASICSKPKVPLILLGVDGYGYKLYQDLKKESQDTVVPIRPVFPSKTFPNFYSIVTGLYPTQHGVISNKFINKRKGKVFSYENDQDPDVNWYKGEPIWITATKQGLVTYCDMWVGSAAKIDGIRPDTYSVYNGSKTFDEKVKDLVKSFDSQKRPDLFVLYDNQPDWSMHRTNIMNKTLLDEILQKTEAKIKLLTTSLDTREYNLLIVSDHGMTSYTNKLRMDAVLKKKAFFSHYYGGPVAFWYTNEEDNVSMIASEITEKMSDVTAFDVRKLPDRLQMCGLEGEGLPEIVIMMQEGTALDVYSQKSGHGYDNNITSMFAMIRVQGPAFRDNPEIKSGPIMTTELYNLFCSLLGITPASNTGSLDTFDFLLKVVPDRINMTYKQRAPPCTEYSFSVRATISGIMLLMQLIIIVF